MCVDRSWSNVVPAAERENNLIICDDRIDNCAAGEIHFIHTQSKFEPVKPIQYMSLKVIEWLSIILCVFFESMFILNFLKTLRKKEFYPIALAWNSTLD